jgi:hypothetical protein
MSNNSALTKLPASRARTPVTNDPNSITYEELAEWLKLVEKHILKMKISKSREMREPSDLSGPSRV